MRLSEIPMDSFIHIAVVKGETSVALQTTPMYASETELCVAPFMHGNTMISFDAKGINIEMLVVRPGEVPFFWSSVTIEKGECDGVPCHIIQSNAVGARLNRRNSFRVFVGLSGTTMEQAGGVVTDVIIRDISSTGIGLIVRGENAPEFKMGALLHITYVDGEARFTIDVDGRVVRRFTLDEESGGGTVYGCQFAKFYPQINKYVTDKQLRNRNKRVPVKRTCKTVNTDLTMHLCARIM